MNRFFENRNRLADVEDRDIIWYFRFGLMNRNMFCKLYEATQDGRANDVARQHLVRHRGGGASTVPGRKHRQNDDHDQPTYEEHQARPESSRL